MAVLIDVDPARQLIAAEAGLVAEFPGTGAADIHAMMVRETRRFDAAGFRDYVSILVARTVRRQLRSRARADRTHA